MKDIPAKLLILCIVLFCLCAMGQSVAQNSEVMGAMDNHEYLLCTSDKTIIVSNYDTYKDHSVYDKNTEQLFYWGSCESLKQKDRQ